jgi:pilus assembly protein CpaB
MPIRSLLLGLIAVSAIVILGIFLQSLFATKQVEQAAAPPPRQVLVAASDMPHGRLLRPEDVRWQVSDKLPPAAVAAALMTQTGGPQQIDAKTMGDNVGAITRRDLAAGEVLSATDIVKPGDRDFLPAVLTPGFRAVTVSVNTLSGSSAGLIYPGDHVDVILTQTFHEANLPIGRRSVGEDIAQDLRVLAIDHYTQGGTVGNNNEPQLRNSARTVTLEASPALAVKIEIAADLGKLTLILRSLDSADGHKDVDQAQKDVDQAHKEDGAAIWAEDTSKALGQIAKFAPAQSDAPVAGISKPAHQVVIYRGDQVSKASESAIAAPEAPVPVAAVASPAPAGAAAGPN